MFHLISLLHPASAPVPKTRIVLFNTGLILHKQNRSNPVRIVFCNWNPMELVHIKNDILFQTRTIPQRAMEDGRSYWARFCWRLLPLIGSFPSPRSLHVFSWEDCCEVNNTTKATVCWSECLKLDFMKSTGNPEIFVWQ